MRIIRITFVTIVTTLVIFLIVSNNAYAIEEYDLGKVPDKTLLEEIGTLFRTIPESEINKIELSQRPDPVIINETRQFLNDLEKECTQKANQYQLRNTETKIKTKLNLLKQFNILEPLVTKLDTQVSEFTTLCVSESEFNREKLRIDSILSNDLQFKKYNAVADGSLTCNIEISQSITSDYKLFNTSYAVLKTYNDSIISRYNQLVVDDIALSESTSKLSERNNTIGQITSKVIEDQKLLDLKIRTAVAEKNKYYEELGINYAALTKQSVLSLEETKKELDSSEVAIGLSLDDGETWMLTKDSDELFRYFSLLKNNKDKVDEIKQTTTLYDQRSEDIRSSLAQKVALNLVLETYALEVDRNNYEITINNEKRQNYATISETHRLLAEERKELNRYYLNNSSTLNSTLRNCAVDSETEFNKYKIQYDALNSDFKKYIDDTFKVNLSQKELTVMTDVKSVSNTEPQLVFTVASKLSAIITQMTSCTKDQNLDILISSEPVSTVTISGVGGFGFEVDGNDSLSKILNDIQSLSASEMPFNRIDINYYVSKLNENILGSFQEETLGIQTILLSPINTWTQDVTTKKDSYVTYNCVNNNWVRSTERTMIKVENGICRNVDVQAISIFDAENKTAIPELLKSNINNLISERQFKLFGTCQTN